MSASGIKLEGPSRRIALVGLVIVLLLGVVIGVTLWREGVADSKYREALRKDATLGFIATASDNLLDTSASVNVMAVGTQVSPAAALFDAAFRSAATEGNMSARAQVQLFQGDFHNEGLRRAAAGKPRGPNLKVPPRRKFRRNFEVVHQQIPEPPCASAIGQTAAHEPHLVAPSHVWR